jgi:hypothetical protein
MSDNFNKNLGASWGMLRQNMKNVGTKKSIPSVFFYRLDTDRFERDTDREGYQQAVSWPQKETCDGPKTMKNTKEIYNLGCQSHTKKEAGFDKDPRRRHR